MWSVNADDPIAGARAWTTHIRGMRWCGEPSGMVHSLLVHHAADIDATIGEAPSSDVRAGLLRAEAEALITAGNVSFFDMGAHGTAEREFKSAMRCARHSDDMRLCGWVFANQSALDIYRHAPDDAVLAADAGMEYTKANPLLSADVLKMRAEAHAVNGDMVRALRDIDNTREAFRDATPEDTPEWLSSDSKTSVDVGRIDGMEGAVWLRLNRPHNAVAPLRRALNANPGNRSYAIVLHADLSIALGRIGEPDEAVRVLLPVLPVAASTHSVERRARVQAAWRAVEPYNTSATRALRDRLRLYHLAA